MSKNRLAIAFAMTCLILGTIPFIVGAASQTDSNSIYISNLYIGSSGEIPNQEYVQITNTGAASENMKGWIIQDDGSKHTYVFPSYTLKAKSTVTLRSGRGTNTANTLYWNKWSFIWNNDGDTAHLYNPQGRLVSSSN
jgi:hypothetical protein